MDSLQKLVKHFCKKRVAGFSRIPPQFCLSYKFLQEIFSFYKPPKDGMRLYKFLYKSVRNFFKILSPAIVLYKKLDSTSCIIRVQRLREINKTSPKQNNGRRTQDKRSCQKAKRKDLL